MKKLALACLGFAPFSGVAQGFDFTLYKAIDLGSHPNTPAAFIGAASVDPGTGMVDIAGTFTSEPFIRTGSYGRQIVVPGEFPRETQETTYDQFVNYTLSVAAAHVDFNVGPSVPTLLQGTHYRVPFDVALTTTVTVTYTITENEVEVGSGSGTYTAHGVPPSVALNMARYPNQLGVEIYPFWMEPRDSTIQSIQFPHGVPMAAPIVPLFVGAVPEPAQWMTMAATGLVAIAVCRRPRRLH